MSVKNLQSTVSLDFHDKIRLTKVVRKRLMKSLQLLLAPCFWRRRPRFPDVLAPACKANVMCAPDVFSNQVLRRRCGIRQGSHRGTLSRSLACTGYCRRMLAIGKISVNSDHVPRCHKGI